METRWHSVGHNKDVYSVKAEIPQQSILSLTSAGHVHVKGLQFFSTLHLSANDFEILFLDYSLIERVGE